MSTPMSGGALSRIGAIVAKEITDTFRDRRAMLVTVITSVVAGPIFLALILNMSANQAEKARTLKLPVVGAAYAPALIAFLERQQVTIETAADDYENRIQAGDMDVVLRIEPDFESAVKSGSAVKVKLIYDRSRDRARPAIEQTESLLNGYGRLWGTQRLLLRGIAPQVARPLTIESIDLATPQQSGSLVLFLVAYYGLFAAVMGGMAGAIDTTAGERERGSLEPLLVTPITTFELATGKWLAIALFNALVVALTLAGFYLTLRFAPLPAIGIPFLFGFTELVRFLLVLLPLIALMPAILVYVGMRGRSLKEAQANISVLLFLLSMVPVIQIFSQRKEPAWAAWVPVSSQYAMLNRALRGDAIPVLEWLQSAAAPALLTVLALVAAARLLNRVAARAPS